MNKNNRPADQTATDKHTFHPNRENQLNLTVGPLLSSAAAATPVQTTNLVDVDPELVGDHLADLGVEALPHLRAPVAHQHRPVKVNVHERATLVQKSGGKAAIPIDGAPAPPHPTRTRKKPGVRKTLYGQEFRLNHVQTPGEENKIRLKAKPQRATVQGILGEENEEKLCMR